MKHGRMFLLVLLLLTGCGGDDGAGPGDGGGDNNPPTPVPTAPGVPDGLPVSATIGAGGGTLSSNDGLFTLDIPAGALSTDTDITVQPLTNTAWGGVGRGYRLTPDGLTFAVPVGLVFSLEDSLVEGSDTAFVDVAVQRDDGVWGVLKHRRVDGGNGTITCRTSHFSDYSLIEGVQIRPSRAIVKVNKTVALSVRYCHRETFTDDEDELAALVISCDEELAPLGDFENWSVNGVTGGNSVVGRVNPTGGHDVVYTAPAEIPPANPVAVSVETSIEGRSGLLVANIYVTGEEQWVGSATVFETAGGDKAVATVTWVQIGVFEQVKYFKPTGFVEYTIGPSDCSFVSLTPDTWIIGDDGLLMVDYSTDPPTYSGGAATFWNTRHCYQCPEHPVQCGDIMVAPEWFFAENLEVHENGTRIDGIELDQNDDPVRVWNFVKQTPPSAPAASR